MKIDTPWNHYDRSQILGLESLLDVSFIPDEMFPIYLCSHKLQYIFKIK